MDAPVEESIGDETFDGERVDDRGTAAAGTLQLGDIATPDLRDEVRSEAVVAVGVAAGLVLGAL